MAKASSNELMKRNITIALAAFVFLVLLYFLVPGYRQTVDEKAIGKWSEIHKAETRREMAHHPEFTLRDKQALRLMDCFWFIDMLQTETPAAYSTVILLPPKKVTDRIQGFDKICNSEWMEYFLFPRLCVSEDEKADKSALYSRITHVAIVDNWGYDKLTYPPARMDTFAVLPIHPTAP